MMIHIVSENDTLFTIAERYQTTVDRIQTDNGLAPGQTLLVGQSLLILKPAHTYTVQRGDTLHSIAVRYQVNIKELLRNNPNLSLNRPLYPGQTVVISFEGEKRGSIMTNGYAYPFINPAILAKTLPYLTMITPFTYGIRADGSLLPLNDQMIRQEAQVIGTNTVMLVSTLDESDRFNSELPGQIFASAEITSQLIQNIVTTAENGGYRYIDIDFEFIPAKDALPYSNFIGKLRESANARGIKVVVALAPKTSENQQGLLYEGHLYYELGNNADYVLLMTYEWGYTFGPPQAVAPIDKVRRVVEYAVSEIPSEKILLGIPNYGYNWKLPYVRGGDGAPSIGNAEAITLAAQYRQDIRFDTTAQAPYFYYTDETGTQHVVWFEDARSVLAKLNLVSEFNLAGISVWNIMRFFPALWLMVNNLYEIAE